MLDLKKVAVTGGLSCGKSSVCRFLEELGAFVVSADKIVHQLLSFDSDLVKKIVELLGSEVLVDQKISRSRIAQIVFDNPDALNALEKLIHPIVYKEIEKEYQRCNCEYRKCFVESPQIFVAEIPLLFESGMQQNYDCVVAVIADKAVVKSRFPHLKENDFIQFDKRMMRQMSQQEKVGLADYVITNNGSLKDLKKATQKLYQTLTKH